MIEIKQVENFKELYDYHLKIDCPFFYKASFDDYLNSLINDTDSYGNVLFKDIKIIGAYKENDLVGFIFYGVSNFGFDNQGNISNKIHYQIITFPSKPYLLQLIEVMDIFF